MIDEKLMVEIRNYLKVKTGIYYFKDIKRANENLLVTCPFHKRGQENKPSAGIRIVAGQEIDVGTFHCFTCGETMGMLQVMQRLLGDLYDEDEVESKFQLKISNIQANIIKEKTPTLFTIPNKRATYNEDELRQYRYYHPYLAQRRISENTANVYDIGYDMYNNQITFPIRDKSRYCVGIGRRSIDKKYYRYPTGMIKPLYGVYELPEKVNYLWIVEGPFNLWSLYEWHKTGVAMLGTGTQNQYNELLDIQAEGYVLALDPDDAGRNGTSKLGKFLNRHNKYNVNVALLPDGKDINDLTTEEFKLLQVTTLEQWRQMYGIY